MTTWLILGAVLLLAVGLVSSQLFRLKDWLARQPAVPNPEPDGQSGDEGGPLSAAGPPAN